MKLKGGVCPECASESTHPERIMGAQTMDIICNGCKYIGHWSEFHPDSANDDGHTDADNDIQEQ